MSNQAILSVNNLVTELYHENQWRPVVSGISFDIAPRETVALVGESGSGKSMTALSLMGLTPKRISRVRGEARLQGVDLLSLPAQQLRQHRGNEMAMIFQEPMTSLNPVHTIGFQIAEALRMHRGLSRAAARSEAIRLLDRVQIPSASSRVGEYPHKFSGGMRQRVMIAMALACQPRLLIADEPTTALDVTIQAQILTLIRNIQEEDGMAVLFITHDMGVVAEIAGRTLVMYKGSVVEQGATPEIFTSATHPYTRRLLAAVPRLGSMKGTSHPRPFSLMVGDAEPAEHITVQAHSAPILEVKGLTTRFDVGGGLLRPLKGRVHAVENVSFDLRPGETLSLVGESGSGKSTTGRSIMRLIEPTAGSVKLCGEELMNLDSTELRRRRSRIQMIFQAPFASLNPRMQVGESIAEPLVINGDVSTSTIKDTVAQLLQRVGLSPDVASRYPHEFSGGQRQRICIARALSVNPQVIVADEAVSALDVSIKAQVINLLMALQAELGIAYLFISHDMAVVERVSHRVAVMYLGEIVEIGPRVSVFGNPQHAYTRRLMEAVPIADPALRDRPRNLASHELASAMRSPGFVPPTRRARQVAEGHYVYS
ncbi:ABC transporter ATP-binding protein [Allopusillimonas soli]|uniref:ABC transporter ATP-binding protein n=1 Tax=Allopusillimonas soli TaxID=659016 RepID=A0A853FFZ0_9BURK|nr:ABC transporter ATP-binding protein [Allopusillimonas soli]NYT37411.1 ABC transporter ATP-binding protein [Allopusillimonas soli]TEA74607.1 ABC transporter ATP-binding protein [Allopusillimonas soli]